MQSRYPCHKWAFFTREHVFRVWTMWVSLLLDLLERLARLLTLCILMDLPIHIDTISMGLPIVHFKGLQIEISKLWCFSVPGGCSDISKQGRPWWNAALCCISSGSSLFAKVPIQGFPECKGWSRKTVNNKGADQTVWLHRLSCAFVFLLLFFLHKTKTFFFLSHGSNWD